jgi:molybdenum cofactor biosynthesis enzyme MoaA
MASEAAPLIDRFGRHISYLRVSVTDRCDFRCVYCMSDTMTFLPRQELLSLEEIDRLAGAFVARGVRKLRLTGGEPLVRRNIMWLIGALSRHLGQGLDDLTLTTNGSQLQRHAAALADCGITRINISLDTLDPAKFRAITRFGDFAQVMRGIDAADRAGLKIKINSVALRDVNEDEIADLIAWSHGRGFDLTLIETMPMGEIDGDTAQPAFHAARHRLPLGRPRALRPCARDWRPARLHHPADAQFLRGVQSGAGHLHGDAVHVSWPGGRGGSPRADARKQVRRTVACRYRRGHRAQAEGPRFRHRPGRKTLDFPPYVDDGRVKLWTRVNGVLRQRGLKPSKFKPSAGGRISRRAPLALGLRRS